jgi:hypothetical protein
MIQTYGKTHLNVSYPWGLFRRYGHRVLCSDGKIRACTMAQTADSFFSVPASIRIKGKTITGYVTGEEQQWIKGHKEYEPFLRVHSFRAHTGQPHNPLPAWPNTVANDQEAIRHNAMIAACHETK